MSTRMVDVAIVGGGLAGGLIALALFRTRPELRLALIEAGKKLGGNHRWSWFNSDISDENLDLLGAIRQTQWDAGYDVSFPQFDRALVTEYRSMSSADFHEGLSRLLPPEGLRLGCAAQALDAQGVTLTDGEHIPARVVIDCRNFTSSADLSGGWQIFMGRHIRLDQPHGLERPIIMDASVDQLAPSGNGGAYRFVYTLPLGAHDLFVEDTYYADDLALDRSALSSRIDGYCRANGWDKGEIIGHESGILPVITGGNFNAYQSALRIEGVTMAGARGGFVHPLTSYTLPVAVKIAQLIAKEADLTGIQLAAMIESEARQHWNRTGFYRALGRMLFQAARPERRVDIFQRFYGLQGPLIERFYAGNSTLLDKARILAGKPPVSIFRAISALRSPGIPLPPEKTA
ncbi:MAG: lycopene beta-cyclase CrtY [Erythrobacter sp.]